MDLMVFYQCKIVSRQLKKLDPQMSQSSFLVMVELC